MRRTNKAAAEDEAQIDLTPMLDVVFIMLIFFIVTASFIKESGIEVNRPQASTALIQEKANILIAIDAQNRIWIDRREIDVRALRPNIERLHAENPKGTVVIQADQDSTNNTLVQVNADGRSARVSGVVSLPGEAKNASQVWVTGTAYDEVGRVVGLRRWEWDAGLAAGGSLPFEFMVSSLGGTIERVEFAVEARP